LRKPKATLSYRWEALSDDAISFAFAAVAWRLVALAPTLAAAVGVVRGTVVLPEELKAGRRFLGHWRVENTTVPVQAAPARGDTVVVLLGPKPQVLAPKNTPVEIVGMQANPSTVVVGEGAVVEFRNSDKVAHDLSVPGHPRSCRPSVLARARSASSASASAGNTWYVARSIPRRDFCDRHQLAVLRGGGREGGFKLPDVPEARPRSKCGATVAGSMNSRSR